MFWLIIKHPILFDSCSWFYRTFPALKWNKSCPVKLKDIEEKFLSCKLMTKQFICNKTCVPSMIHSARPTVQPVAITILTWKSLPVVSAGRPRGSIQLKNIQFLNSSCKIMSERMVRGCWSDQWSALSNLDTTLRWNGDQWSWWFW